MSTPLYQWIWLPAAIAVAWMVLVAVLYSRALASRIRAKQYGWAEKVAWTALAWLGFGPIVILGHWLAGPPLLADLPSEVEALAPRQMICRGDDVFAALRPIWQRPRLGWDWDEELEEELPRPRYVMQIVRFEIDEKRRRSHVTGRFEIELPTDDAPNKQGGVPGLYLRNEELLLAWPADEVVALSFPEHDEVAMADAHRLTLGDRVLSFLRRPCLLGTTGKSPLYPKDIYSSLLAAYAFYLPALLVPLVLLLLSLPWLEQLREDRRDLLGLAARGCRRSAELVLEAVDAVPRYAWVFLVYLFFHRYASYAWWLCGLVVVLFLRNFVGELQAAVRRYRKFYLDGDRSLGMAPCQVMFSFLRREGHLYVIQIGAILAAFVLIEITLASIDLGPTHVDVSSLGRMVARARPFIREWLRLGSGNKWLLLGPALAGVSTAWLSVRLMATLKAIKEVE